MPGPPPATYPRLAPHLVVATQNENRDDTSGGCGQSGGGGGGGGAGGHMVRFLLQSSGHGLLFALQGQSLRVPLTPGGSAPPVHGERSSGQPVMQWPQGTAVHGVHVIVVDDDDDSASPAAVPPPRCSPQRNKMRTDRPRSCAMPSTGWFRHTIALRVELVAFLRHNAGSESQ